MNLTLDHNAVIDLANNSVNTNRLREILEDSSHQAYVVEIGASEMRKMGIQPDRYDLFEDLLDQAQISHLPRLAPIMIFDVTFWDHCLWADKEMIQKYNEIEQILFGNSPKLNISEIPDNSPIIATWVNRVCDIQSIWCHLHYKNDVFVTSDNNFHKKSKLPRLLQLGVGRVCKPEQL